jgi:hypothetical protein
LGRTLITLRLPEGLAPPLFPASLVDDSGDWRQVVHLDAVVQESGDTVVFETEETPQETIEGRTLGFQQWWRPEALELVTDVGRRWERTAAPSPEHHEHCMLDSATIETGVGDGTGWRSDRYWVCVACFEHFFEHDHLGVRSGRTW